MLKLKEFVVLKRGREVLRGFYRHTLVRDASRSGIA